MTDSLPEVPPGLDGARSYAAAIEVMGAAAEVRKAPFPWFCGKSSVAPMVWEGLGKVDNYVEPFFGSGAVLLQRPHKPGIETVNDLDRFVSNFWRAVRADPDGVAAHADWPVNEADLEARHHWLVTQGRSTLEPLLGDPEAFDSRVAGWWLWGICSWIGSGWCSGEGPWRWDGAWQKGNAGQGINRQLPHLGTAGRGINRKLPYLGDAGQGIKLMMESLAARMRRVRVCCGDWSRVCGPSVTFKLGLTGVFLDPPYADAAKRTAGLYAEDSLSVAHDVREWAIEAGGNPLMRICIAGYQGEHDMPHGWRAVRWKADGGYGSQSAAGKGRDNALKETLWFSPHCVAARQPDLFVSEPEFTQPEPMDLIT